MKRLINLFFQAVILATGLILLAGDRPAAAEEVETWKLILQRNTEELQALSSQVQIMNQRLPDDLKLIRSVLVDGEKRFDRLKVQESLTGANPWEVRSILQGLFLLERDMNRGFKPFWDSSTELQRQDEHLITVEKDFKEQVNDSVTGELEQALTAYLKSLQDVRKTLQTVKRRLDNGLAPSQTLFERMGKMRSRLEGDMPKILSNFFLGSAPNFLTPPAWKASQTATAKWLQSLKLSTSSFVRDDIWWFGGVAGRIVLYVALFSALGFGGFRLAVRKVPALAVFSSLKKPALWLLVSLGFFIAAAGTQTERFDLLTTIGQIIAARGLLALAWELRLMAGAAPDEVANLRHGNHLRFLWGIFALGLLLQVFIIPGPTLTPFWTIALAGTTWRLAKALRHPTMYMEDVVGRVSCGLLPVMALMAILGWAQLSVLLTTAWFLLAVSTQLGLGVSQLIKKWQGEEKEEGWAALAHGLIYGLGFPMIFLSLLSMTVGWLAMHLGGATLLGQVSDLQVGWGAISFNLFRLVVIFVLFFFTRSGVHIIHSVLRQLPGRWPEFDRGTVDSLQTVSTYFLWVVFILLALYLLGVNFTSLAVIAGGLSVGIGFGLQNIVNNFVAGLIILFGRSVLAGDIIQLGSLTGKVRKVQIRNTIVQTFDNATIFVPNSNLITNHLINFSHRDPTVRREILVGVAYGSDTTMVRDLLIKAASTHPNVLESPAPDVVFKDFGASSLDFVVRFWVDINREMGCSSDIRFTIEKLFRENGIEIAFPQQELTLRSAPGLERLLARQFGVELDQSPAQGGGETA